MKFLPLGVVWLSLASLFNDIASEAIYPLLPVYLTATLGATTLAVGLIEGIAETTSAVLKLFAGVWSDRIGKAKPLVTTGYLISNLAKGALSLAGTWPQVLLLRFCDRVGKGIRSAPRDAWLARLATPEQLPAVFGFHRGMDHLGAVVGPLAASLFLYFYPGDYRALFLCALVPGLFSVFLTLLPAETSLPHMAIAGPKNFRDLPSDLKRFAAVLALFTLANSSDAFLLLRLRESGIPVALLPALWAALHVVKMLASLASASLTDRFGPRTLILSGWFLYAGVYASLAFFSDPRVLALVFCGYGIFFGVTEAPEKTIVARLAPAHLKGSAFGLYALATALPALPASLLLGMLWQSFGYRVALLTGAGIALLAAALLAFTSSSTKFQR